MRFYIFFLFLLLSPKNLLFAQTGGADFNGDGISDVVGFENQHDGSANELAITWISSADASVNRLEYGKSIQSSVPADYDGDGITDFAIVGLNDLGEYLWQYKLSSNSGVETSDIFGIKDDLVFYGCSFDNDLKADRAVINATGLFTYEKSSDDTTAVISLAAGLDRLLCADLDGDGVVSVFDYIILSDSFDLTGD